MTSAQIINAILEITPVVLMAFIIPWLKAKQGTEKVKQEAKQFDVWTAMAEKVVDAAYQMFATNDERKAFAVSTLKALGVPAATIDTVVEAAVKGCKVAGTAIAEIKKIETVTDAAAGVTPVDAEAVAKALAAHAEAEKLAKLTAAAQALGVAVTPGMDAPALQTAISAAVAA